jgi:UDP-N-acetylmuramate--alanine ligase
MRDEGFTISGCDLVESSLSEQLAKGGATVWLGHDPAHVETMPGLRAPDLLVVSSAVAEHEPELLAARAAGIPVYKRADVLGELMADRMGVAIAGTHGKTTTTAMTAFVLSQAGLDPTYIVGGVLKNTGTNAHAGRGRPFVIEADEYDRMFLGLRPRMAVVTGVEHDHPDKFSSLQDVRAAFDDFVNLLPDDGLLVACYDDPQSRDVAERRGRVGLPVFTYGLSHGSDLRAVEVIANRDGGSDFIVKQGLMMKGMVRLQLPGQHNVQNCLAVLALAERLGVQFELVAAVLSEFEGVERRFEFKGRVTGVTVIDDYAHHPTAVRTTISAARTRYGSRPLWIVFQPHTFTRTKTLLDSFATAFDEAEHVLVTDIYRSRETDDLGISSADLVGRMNHPDARHMGEMDAIVDYLVEVVEPGDVVITMSAGDATQIGDALLAALEERADVRMAVEEARLDELVDEFLTELARQEDVGLVTAEEARTWRDFLDEATLTPGLLSRILTRLHRGEEAGDEGSDDD